MYVFTSSLFSILGISSLISLPSGAITKKVIPYIVSIQVVNMLNFPPPTMFMSTSTPVDLPIQFICPSFTFSAK